MRLNTVLAAALALLVAGPSVSLEARTTLHAGAHGGRHPESGLKVIPLRIGTHKFAVEVAASPAEQEKGLMFRKKMGPDEGMLFPMNPPRQSYFWMRNTLIPLDIIFIGPDRRIINVAVRARPLDETPLPSAGKAAAVLELSGGRAAELGIGTGDLVTW